MEPALLYIGLPLGIILLLVGIQVYRGKWLGILVLESVLPGRPGFAALFLGWWLATLPFAGELRESPVPVLGQILALSSLAALAIGVVGCFWMPRFLHPRWSRELDAEIARGEDSYSKRYRPSDEIPG